MTEAKPAPVALVTGGAQGIGRGIVQWLLIRGWRVAIADVDTEAGEESLQIFSDYQQAVTFIECDTSQEAAVEACVAKTLETFQRLDGLVNNAGIANPINDPIEKLSLDYWNRILGINLTGYFLMAKHAVPALRQSQGAIVNIASVRAFQSDPHQEAYAAAKGGIVSLTHALALSLGPAVRVNCISPGWIVVSDWQKASERQEPSLREVDHAQHPAGRAGRPDDIAAMVEFLLSEKAEFITGQNIVIDGGMNRKLVYAE
jgi:NAD(P)-dependent dehydrogenase (short-subunit alcohol dehydrogenase family)